MNKEIVHDRENKRFYIAMQEGEAVMEYFIKDDVMEIYHTFVPPHLRGQGLAGLLAEKAARTAEKENLKIKASCSFMKIYLKKNKKYYRIKK